MKLTIFTNNEETDNFNERIMLKETWLHTWLIPLKSIFSEEKGSN